LDKPDPRNGPFHYALESKPVVDHDKALENLLRTQIVELLSVVELFNGHEPVTIDGFRFINERGFPKPVFTNNSVPQNNDSTE